MTRFFVGLFALASIAALAAPHPAAAQSVSVVAPSFIAALGDGEGDDEEDNKPHVRAKDAGSIDGEIVAVDYRTNHIVVKSGSSTYDVLVLPSTDFRGRSNGFHGITDLRRGAHVNVMLSQREKTLTAQIVHLLQ
jgi:hypothetical protein